MTALVILVLVIALIATAMTAYDLYEDLWQLQQRHSQPGRRGDYVDELLLRARRRIDEITRIQDGGNRADDA